MKKTLLLIVMCLLVGATAGAKTKAKPKAVKTQTYTVEKAHNVYDNGIKVSVEQTLTDKSQIEITENGYLMIVNQKAKKRYYISKPIKSTVKNLVALVKAPKSVSKAYLESMMTNRQNRSRDTYSSAGYVTMRPGPGEDVYLENVEADKNGEIKVYMIEED